MNRRKVGEMRTVCRRLFVVSANLFFAASVSSLFRRQGGFLTKLKRNIRRLAAKQFSSETNDEWTNSMYNAVRCSSIGFPKTYFFTKKFVSRIGYSELYSHQTLQKDKCDVEYRKGPSKNCILGWFFTSLVFIREWMNFPLVFQLVGCVSPLYPVICQSFHF